MCGFCKEIYSSRLEVINAIAEDITMDEGIYKENGVYYIYVGDSFEEQYGILYNIKYCPYCGEKLNSIT